MHVNCPYCDAVLYVDTDDNTVYGGGKNEMSCDKCESNFVFTAEINITYDSFKADCLNGVPHKYELTHTYPKEFSKMECIMCGKLKDLTIEERKKHNIGTISEYFKNITNESR